MDKFKKILDNLEYYIAAFCLGLMTFLCFIQVVSRYVFNFSITWAEELSVMLFIVSVFIGAIGGTRRNMRGPTVCHTLADIGIQGVEIVDRAPLSDEDKKQMFVDILPEFPHFPCRT